MLGLPGTPSGRTGWGGTSDDDGDGLCTGLGARLGIGGRGIGINGTEPFDDDGEGDVFLAGHSSQTPPSPLFDPHGPWNVKVTL